MYSCGVRYKVFILSIMPGPKKYYAGPYKVFIVSIMPGPKKYYAGPYKVFIVSIMPGTSDHLYTQEPLSSTWDCFVWMEMCEYLSPNILSAFSLGTVIFIHSFIGDQQKYCTQINAV